MIDTDKYEGHTPGPWRWFGLVNDTHGASLVGDADDYGLPLFRLNGEPTELDSSDVILIADAPLLLEAYRELQDYHAALLHWVMYHLDKDEDEVKEMIYE